MQRWVQGFLVGALVVGSFFTSQAQILFTAAMDGAQETPPNASTAQGTLWAVLSSDMSTLTYQLTFAQLSAQATGMHFHVGVPGVSGPVVFPISFSGNTASGTWSNVPDTIVQHLIKGELYANVHSSNFPGGEIRGRLTLAPGMGFTISADQAQETPPTGSAGTGTGYAFIDSLGNQLTYRITVAGLSDTVTGSHFHAGAVGVPGGVVHPISFTDSLSSGGWTGFADSIYGLLARDHIYFNIHTKAHPGGEIRGVLASVTGQRFAIRLNGAQETPPNNETGHATGWAILSADGSSLTFRSTFAGLTGPVTGSHLHAGAPGVAGSVVHPFTPVGNTASSVWSSPADSILRALLEGDVYMNFHTSAHPGGEIRGQLVPASAIELIIGLNASQESGVTSPGTGTGYGLLDSLGRKLSYEVTVAALSDTLTAAHFHLGAPGVNGGVVEPVAFTDSTSAGEWTGYPDADISGFVKGAYYFNVHTKAHPGGEIRGQMVFEPSVLTSVTPVGASVPRAFSLEQNYPNPFNPSTVIEFSLTAPARVTLKVFNVIGQQVATLVDDARAAGVYRTTFNAGSLASGVYFYRLSTNGGQQLTRRMLLLK
ncbi:MAG: CHRD domain-containing protein [Bacteroidota bacterium]